MWMEHCVQVGQSFQVQIFFPHLSNFSEQKKPFFLFFQVTLANFPRLFADAYERAMTVKNVTAGFEGSGIYPFDSDKPFTAKNLQRYVGTEGTKNIDEVLQKLKPLPQENAQENNEKTPSSNLRVNVPHILTSDPKAKHYIYSLDSTGGKHYYKLQPKQLIMVDESGEKVKKHLFF